VKWTQSPSYPGAYDTDYVIETSTNLVNWNPVPMVEVTIGATVGYTMPDDGPQHFVRLKVSGP